MTKKFVTVMCVVLALCFILSGVSCAQEKQTFGQRVKNFWQKLFNYPANVMNETAGVITSTTAGATNVVANEVKTVGQVTSGNLGKTKDLVTEPLVGTAETTKNAIEGTALVPVKANKEEPKK